MLALIGLAVNAGVDLDNMYDMTTTALWVVVLLVALAAALTGRSASAPKQAAASSAPSA